MSSACEPLGLRPWVFYIYLLAKPAACQACGLFAFIYILPAAWHPGGGLMLEARLRALIRAKMGAAAPKLIRLGLRHRDIALAIQAQHRTADRMTESFQRIGRRIPSFRRLRQIWLR